MHLQENAYKAKDDKKQHKNDTKEQWDNLAKARYLWYTNCVIYSITQRKIGIIG